MLKVSPWKRYADKRRKPLEFSVGDYVMLKVSPWKGVLRFGKKEKLAPRFVGPFEIIEKVGPVAYQLDLPEELNGVHDTFHVSDLKKCLADPTLQVPLDEIRVDAKLNFMEEPVEILEREFKKLKRSRIKNEHFVMSDSEHSTVTYTEISSEFKDLSDIGSPGGIVHGYYGLPMMPEDPYAYIKVAMQEPPPPDFVPESVYPEFMPPKDDVLLAEEQPLPAAVSPIADSLGYITESDEDPKEEDDEDPEEDPTDYPTDRDDKEDEEESSGDDADDEGEDKDEDEEST
ncbi:hypothetical protein Tco_1189052 [Tanacetum coccineum]